MKPPAPLAPLAPLGMAKDRRQRAYRLNPKGFPDNPKGFGERPCGWHRLMSWLSLDYQNTKPRLRKRFTFSVWLL